MKKQNIGTQEQELQSKNKRPLYKDILHFPQISDASPEPILITDNKVRIYYVNAAWEKLTGYTFCEVQGKNPRFLQSEKTNKKIYKHLWEALSEGKSFSTDEIRNKRKNGTEYQIHTTYFPIRKKNRNIFYVQLMYDITEHNAYVKSLYEKEEILDRIINNTYKYAIFMIDKNGYIKTWNTGAQNELGYKSNEVLGKHITLFYPPEDVKKNKPQNILKLAAKKGKYEEESLRIKKDGSLYWAHVVITPIQSRKGTIKGFVKITSDITERVQYRKALEEKEKKYRFLMEQASDAIIIHNPERKIIETNYQTRKMLGYTSEELQKMYANELIKSEDKQLTNQVKKKLLSGKPVIIERELIRKDGTSFPVEISSKMIEGNLIQSIIRDASKRKEVEDVLRFRDQILLSMAEGVCIVKLSNHKIIYTNPAFENMLGYTKNELIGKNISIINESQKIWPKTLVKEISDTIHRRQSWSGEVINTKKDKSSLLSLATISLVSYPTIGDCWIGVHQDITERKEIEKQKDAFIGIASHELKTPITSLLAYVQLLEKNLKRKNDTRDMYFVSNIVSQTKRLTALIDDLLHVSRIQSGKMDLQFQETDINKLIKNVLIDFQYTTDSHEIVKKGDIQKKVICDENRIRQVLTNFLTNAIKYSPKANKIIIHLSTKKNDAVIAVQDFGSGIAKEDMSNIFTRFYRTKEKQKATVEGFGLGLYISSEIIKRHKGKIWVESELEKGSTFYFSLPFKT